jgi:hypothetical protein
MKLYGAALHVYELVEPEDLSRMLGHPIGTAPRCTVLHFNTLNCTVLNYTTLY